MAEKELLRLDFQHGIIDEDEDYLSGICTHAMQGKIFYMSPDGLFYTQSRDDIPKRMFIRGKEFPKEDYFPQFETISKLKTEKTIVLMVSRQDLLITHKSMDGTQVFVLGFLSEDGFVPSATSGEKFFEENGIETVSNYGEDGKIYIPARITKKEDLGEMFVYTKDGVPVTTFSKRIDQIFELFSDTQNNSQLFIKIFFVKRRPDIIQDIESHLEEISKIAPIDKTEDFIVLVEKFRNFMSLMKTRKVCHGLANDTVTLYFEYDKEDEEVSKRMEKPNKALGTMITNLKRMLWENKCIGNSEGLSIHDQVSGAVMEFFKYEKNVNNCCHILKHQEKLRA